MSPPTPQDLLTRAMDAMAHAYCPYSSFRVGAALLTTEDEIFHGCNIENASFGLTVCAERTAVFSAVAAGRRSFRALAIAAAGDEPPYPCGACLQVLAEFCAPDLPIYVGIPGAPSQLLSLTLQALLPKTFRLGGSPT